MDPKKSTWTESIELGVKILTMMSLIAGGAWALVTYRSTRNAELEQRRRELTKPYREEQLKLCEEVATTSSRVATETAALMYSDSSRSLEVRGDPDFQSRSQSRQWERNASVLAGEIARINVGVNNLSGRAVMFGDEELATLLERLGEVAIRCGNWAHQPKAGLTTIAIFERELADGGVGNIEVRPNACLECLQYLSMRAAEHCMQLVKGWWLEKSVSGSTRLSDNRRKEMADDELFLCEHPIAVHYWGK